jgi:hypothetical protein
VAYYVDSMGRLVEADASRPEELAALAQKGYAPASQQDIERHNHRTQVAQADEGGFSGTAFAQGAKRAGSFVGEGISTAVDAAGQLVGAGVDGLVPEGHDVSFVDRAAARSPEAFSEEARLRAQAHPFSAGLGTGAVATPLAIPAGLLAGSGVGALGAGALAATGATVLGEAAIEAVAQEYDDAWLEERNAELKNIAAYTGMFALGDVVLRGLGAGIARAFKKPEADVQIDAIQRAERTD